MYKTNAQIGKKYVFSGLASERFSLRIAENGRRWLGASGGALAEKFARERRG